MKLYTLNKFSSVPEEIKNRFAKEPKRSLKEYFMPKHFAKFLELLFESEEYLVKDKDTDLKMYMECYSEIMDSYARLTNTGEMMSIKDLINDLELKNLLSDDRYPYFCKLLISKALFRYRAIDNPNDVRWFRPIFDPDDMTMRQYFNYIDYILTGNINRVI